MSEHIIVTEVCYGVPFVPIGGTGELREEIVRCSDCVLYTEDEAEYYHYCGSWREQVEPNGFCAWGERK